MLIQIFLVNLEQNLALEGTLYWREYDPLTGKVMNTVPLIYALYTRVCRSSFECKFCSSCPESVYSSGSVMMENEWFGINCPARLSVRTCVCDDGFRFRGTYDSFCQQTKKMFLSKQGVSIPQFNCEYIFSKFALDNLGGFFSSNWLLQSYLWL